MKTQNQGTKKKTVTFRFPRELNDLLTDESKRTGMTRTELLEMCLETSLSSVAVAETERRAKAAREFAQAQKQPAKS